MTLFWILAGLLLAGALLFVVPPLLGGHSRKAAASSDEVNVTVYRDQLRELDTDLAQGTITRADYEAARLEIERRLLDDVDGGTGTAMPARGVGRVAAPLIAFAVSALAVGLYTLLGSPQALEPAAVAANPQGDSHSLTEEQISQMVDKLAARLNERSGTAEDWLMLARSYQLLGRYGEAAAAYAKVAGMMPGDAGVLADYADVLAMAQNRRLQGEPERLIARALAADPNNLKALALAGSAAFERKDYDGAIAQWQKILSQVPPDSEFARSIGTGIAEAQSLRQPVPGKALASGSISGTVRLAPPLVEKVAANDAVFVFARAAAGPRMPLAIVRKQVKDLPFSFSLDDSMAMTPESRLSSVEQVVVGARVSKSGDAAPRPGDLQGFSGPVQVGARGLNITIDAVVQ